MEFLDQELENYVVAHTSPETDLLQNLNRETHLKVLQPRMLSGHLQGRVLSMLSQMIKPKRILEIGTYTGYATLCLAEGLDNKGEIHTIDINEELEPFVRKYIRESGNTDRIFLHIGNALEIIPELKGHFDLVFIDADKTNYSKYYQLVIDRLSDGGYIIADNVLWSGKVLDETQLAQDADTIAIDRFNKEVLSDQRVENVLFPIRDGLMVIWKKL